MAQATTWNGSAHRTALGHLSATTVAIQSAASAETCVIAAHCSAPRASKNFPSVALSRPGADPSHDGTDRAPCDPQQLLQGGLDSLGCQPRRHVVEGEGVPGVLARPRHVCHDNPVLRARNPSCVGLQEGPERAQIQRPPPPTALALVIPRAPPPAHPTSARGAPAGPYVRHQSLLSSSPSNSTPSMTVFSTPSRPAHVVVWRTPFSVRFGILRESRTYGERRVARSDGQRRPTEATGEPAVDDQLGHTRVLE